MNEDLDVAVLEFVSPAGETVPPEPVTIAGPDYRATVGEPIGICGYAHGTVLLREGKEVSRFGPLAQQGIISAISPFDVSDPNLLLLDLTTAPAASGSPVFRLEDAAVVGILVKGQEGRNATISVAARVFVHPRRCDANAGAGEPPVPVSRILLALAGRPPAVPVAAGSGERMNRRTGCGCERRH
jgi:hypothetical protein